MQEDSKFSRSDSHLLIFDLLRHRSPGRCCAACSHDCTLLCRRRALSCHLHIPRLVCPRKRNTMLSLLLITLALLDLSRASPSTTQKPLLQSTEDDHQYPVPGHNALEYCKNPENYTLGIDHIDISPQEPKA